MMTPEELEIELRQLHGLASNAGVAAVQEAGFKLKGPSDMEKLSPKAHKIFLRGCHYGFGAAQARIGKLVIDIQAEGGSFVRISFRQGGLGIRQSKIIARSCLLHFGIMSSFYDGFWTRSYFILLAGTRGCCDASSSIMMSAVPIRR
jgi:hypothetical protein